MGGRAGVEVPLRRVRWVVWDTGVRKGGVEGARVECAAGWSCGHVCRRHRLLRKEQRTGAQNACSWGAKRHGPGLHHALPRVVARGPWSGLCVGVVGVPGARRAAVAATTATAPILAVVGTVVAAVVGSGRRGGRRPVLVAGGRRVGGATGVVAVSHSESLASFGVGVVLGAELLEDEEGMGALEGVRRVLGRDH